MLCRFFATLVCVGYVAVASADDGDCQDLSTLDEAQLATFRFDVRDDLAVTRALSHRRDYVVGEVRVVVQPIFDTTDPAEDHPLFRWANRLHAPTRSHTIREAILFREGEPVSVSALLESERILRAKPYLFDARVIPRRLCGDRLDVDVVARDVWTLTPDADFARSGGDNSYGYGVTDTNLFGAGRTLSLFFTKDADRSGEGVYYANPNVAGSRVQFQTLFENNSDGSHRYVDVGQPFYSFDAKRAFGLRLEEIDEEQALYFRSDKFDRFSEDVRLVSVNAGVSDGEIEGHTWRWLAGYNYEEHEFGAIAGQMPPDPLPANRKYGYPWLGVSSVEDRFDTTVNVDRIYRTEDLDLGRQYNALLGWTDSTFGGDDARRLVLRSDYRDGIGWGQKHLVFYGANLSGYWNFDLDRSEEVRALAYATYRQQQTGRFSLAATTIVQAVHNLPTDEQQLGGGDTGLRGYPSRYQWGNRSYLFSLEERYFSDIYIARIVRVGVALFVDAGRTWFSDHPGGDGYGVLADAGFGLRFESTRTRPDRVLHIDFAFPLVDGPDVQSMQILLVVKERL